ncbi:unnamed protein product [Bathycoccus prasinos]
MQLSLNSQFKLLSFSQILLNSANRRKRLQGNFHSSSKGTSLHDNRSERSSAAPLQRISKLLACNGICSRREAEILIANEQVLLNGDTVVLQGWKASEEDIIEVTQAGQAWLDRKVTLVLNKPRGYESMSSLEVKASALALICKENEHLSEHKNESERNFKCEQEVLNTLSTVGRLDKESRGLLIFTGDGSLARKLINVSSTPKRYLVTVDEDVHNGHIDFLRGQLYIDGEALLTMSVDYISPRVLAFTLTEGKNRQIRRCCAMVGLRVLDLCRISIGSFELGNLPEGTLAKPRTEVFSTISKSGKIFMKVETSNLLRHVISDNVEKVIVRKSRLLHSPIPVSLSKTVIVSTYLPNSALSQARIKDIAFKQQNLFTASMLFTSGVST